MADEYKDNGVTFAGGNARFETGTRVGATGYKINGVDLNTLYEDIASGSAATDAVTNFHSGGVDLGGIFAGVGTLENVAFSLSSYTATTTVIGGGAYAGLEVASTGDINRYLDAASQTQPGPSDIGDWVVNKTGLNITDYEFRVGNRSGLEPLKRNSAVGVTIPTSGFSSWTSFGANGAEWYLAQGSSSSLRSFTLEVREFGTTGGDSCTINLEIAV